MLQEAIPANVRKMLYIIGAVVGLALAATQAAFSSLDAGQPPWLVAAFAVYGVLAAGLGLTAAGNMPQPPGTGVHRDDGLGE